MSPPPTPVFLVFSQESSKSLINQGFSGSLKKNLGHKLDLFSPQCLKQTI